MKKINIGILIVLLSTLMVAGQLWKNILPHQINYTINNYLNKNLYQGESNYKLYEGINWLDGIIVPIESDKMVGVVYLEKKLTTYKVKNHALHSKTDPIREPFMGDIDFQYKLLRVQAFVDDKDIILAYIKNDAIKTFTLENIPLQYDFELLGNNKLVFGEVNKLFSVIKINSNSHERDIFNWRDEKIEERLKYNFENYVHKSLNPLKIVTLGNISINTDKSILFEKASYEDLINMKADTYDALFINSTLPNTDFSREMLDKLISNKWDIFIFNPNQNPHLFRTENIGEDTIVIETGRGAGSWSKYDYYDLESNYTKVYNSIFELLSMKKDM